jgi:hypothetical protein
MFNRQPKEPGLFSGIATAYTILILHVALVAIIGVLVLFFRGVVSYIFWVFLAVMALLAGGGCLFYRRLKKQRSQMMETLETPTFRNRPVEISFLGGLASLRVGGPTDSQDGIANEKSLLQLEDPDSMKLRKLNELAQLFENDLISRNEYDTLKKRLLATQPIFLHDDEAS